MSKVLLISLVAAACIFAGTALRSAVANVFTNKVTPAIAAAQNVEVKQCRTSLGENCSVMESR